MAAVSLDAEGSGAGAAEDVLRSEERGASGEQRTLRYAAKWADATNFGGAPAQFARKRDVLLGHLEKEGRELVNLNAVDPIRPSFALSKDLDRGLLRVRATTPCELLLVDTTLDPSALGR